MRDTNTHTQREREREVRIARKGIERIRGGGVREVKTVKHLVWRKA